MDFVDAVRLIVRRWAVFVPVLAIVGAAGALYVSSAPAKYKATANVVFVAPAIPSSSSSSESALPVNPLTPTDLSLIVHDVLVSSSTQAQVAAAGGSGYAVGDPTNNPSPLMTITVTAAAPGTAIRTASQVIHVAQQEAATRQLSAGAPVRTFDRVLVVTGPGPATRQSAGKVRAAAALGILALILAVVAAFLVDNVLSRSGERRQADAARSVVEREAAAQDGLFIPVTELDVAATGGARRARRAASEYGA